jgi:hypothetical protein
MDLNNNQTTEMGDNTMNQPTPEQMLQFLLSQQNSGLMSNLLRMNKSIKYP